MENNAWLVKHTSQQLIAYATITIMASFLSFFPIGIPAVFTANLPIGAECEENADCRSGDCEGSQNNGKSYCDCSSDNTCKEEYGAQEDETWDCVDGAHATYDLDYCVSNIKGVRYAITPRESSVTDQLLDPSINASEIQQMIGTPVTKISIPGVNFSEVKVAEEVEDGSTYLFIPFLGEYIAAVYRYAVVVIAIVAILAIISAGFMWTMSAGDSGTIEKAKSTIGNALIGLVLAVGSYTILYTINPNLVTFKSLKVRYVKGIPVEVLYEEGAPDSTSDQQSGLGFVGGNPTPKGSEKCVYDTFTPGKAIGEKPDTERINFLGLGNIPFNSNAIDVLRRVEQEILTSNDPEVQGYLQYMRDVKAKKVPDLLGSKDGAGVVSNFLGRGIGVGRKSGQPLKSMLYDMHVMGLAVDIMTRSNWDINWGGTKKGAPAERYCNIYQTTLNRMKNGDFGEELKKDPYHMYDRLQKKITNCLNKFDNGNDPYTSLPQGFIDAFTKNGFYWGGYGWGNKMRTDGMHFEYRGSCAS